MLKNAVKVLFSVVSTIAVETAGAVETVVKSTASTVVNTGKSIATQIKKDNERKETK